MAQFLAILISLAFIYRQIRLQRMGNSLTTLAQFETRWTSEEMVQARKTVCTTFRDNERIGVQSAERIASFFEEIGLYVQKKVFDLDLVWELYSTYIEHYWPILEPRMSELRRNDPTVYTNFHMLHKKVKKFSAKRGAPSDSFSREQLLKFAEEELQKS
jgi:hypothetical protein